MRFFCVLRDAELVLTGRNVKSLELDRQQVVNHRRQVRMDVGRCPWIRVRHYLLLVALLTQRYLVVVHTCLLDTAQQHSIKITTYHLPMHEQPRPCHPHSLVYSHSLGVATQHWLAVFFVPIISFIIHCATTKMKTETAAVTRWRCKLPSAAESTAKSCKLCQEVICQNRLSKPEPSK